MTVFALNVGLKIDATGFIIPADLALSVLASHGIVPAYPGFLAAQPRVAQSETEPTLVGRFTNDGTIGYGDDGNDRYKLFHAIYLAAEALQQAAIAVVWPGDIGELIGPNAAAWGQFDPTRFIQP